MKDRHELTDKYGKAAVGIQPNGLWVLYGADGLPEPYQNYRANAEILRLAAEVERLRAEREWRPIETAPKDGTEVLLWVVGARWIGRWAECYGEGSPQGWCLDGAMCANPPDAYDVNGDQPTHWMPLPEPTDEVCG